MKEAEIKYIFSHKLILVLYFGREMASPTNRKAPQPAEGTEFPPMNLSSLVR